MTQLKKARTGIITPEMEAVARKEHVDVVWLREKIAEGRIVIPSNVNHQVPQPCGVGESLLIKVNANIGTSADRAITEEELQKLKVAVEAGADTVMAEASDGSHWRE